jgi:hypothetical protein
MASAAASAEPYCRVGVGVGGAQLCGRQHSDRRDVIPCTGNTAAGQDEPCLAAGLCRWLAGRAQAVIQQHAN